jgi:hypothetical protein
MVFSLISMSRTAIILILLIFISLSLALYLILSSKPVTIEPSSDTGQKQISEKSDNEASRVDLEELENSYKQAVKFILADYKLITVDMWPGTSTTLLEEGDQPATLTEYKKSPSEILELAQELENRLMALTVPSQFKNLHLNLVLAISKLSNYIESGDEEERSKSQALIEQAKTDNEWLH